MGGGSKATAVGIVKIRLLLVKIILLLNSQILFQSRPTFSDVVKYEATNNVPALIYNELGLQYHQRDNHPFKNAILLLLNRVCGL
ncbi:hypothetical protein HanPSC8_Chr11g0501021 [Helianthus annuus]|nr:hypothetical protein HanPSC8_Chr11g0501021 [Helianthus annuus]